MELLTNYKASVMPVLVKYVYIICEEPKILIKNAEETA